MRVTSVRFDTILGIVTVWIFICFASLTYCGRVKRIVGGVELECGSHPRVASLRNVTTLEHMCGATLLSTQAAITAAHCVYAEPTDYVLQLNNYCFDMSNIKIPKATISAIHRHELYNKHSRAHDIAIMAINLHLEDISWLTEDILPRNIFGTSGECAIAGYGVKQVNSNITSEKLVAAKVNIISMDECLEKLGIYMAPSSNSGMMCAVGIDCADSCQGDSGGPLMCSNDYILEGICSYGQSCGVAGIPAVYTGVSAHLPWIRATLQQINDDALK